MVKKLKIRSRVAVTMDCGVFEFLKVNRESCRFFFCIYRIGWLSWRSRLEAATEAAM